MRLNELLAELTRDWGTYGEWPYFISFFGDPASGEPWGWQLDGHHLCLNAVVVDQRLVLTPLFMGAEPARPRRAICRHLPVRSRGATGARSQSAPSMATSERGRRSGSRSNPTPSRPACRTRTTAGWRRERRTTTSVSPYQGVPGSEMARLPTAAPAGHRRGLRGMGTRGPRRRPNGRDRGTPR